MNRTNQITSRWLRVKRVRRLNKRKLGFEPLEARRLLTAEVEPNDSRAQATLFTRGEQTLEGTISSAADVDWYQVALVAGDRLFVGSYKDDFSGVSGSASQMPRYVIQDSSSRVWAQSDVGRVDGFTVVNGGTYFVGLFHDNVIQEFIAPYSVTAWTVAFDGVKETEPNSTLATANDLSAKENFSGRISAASDVDVFKLQLQSGDSIGLRYSGAAGPAVELIGPDGKLVASDASGLGLAAKVNGSGEYSLRLTAGQQKFTENYQANLVRSARGMNTEGGNSFETAASLGFANVVPNSDRSAAGMLASVGEADYYAVNLDANQLYRFQLSSTSTTLYPRPGKSLASDGRRISVYNEYGQWLESSYGDATSGNYFFARPEVTGRHYIVVEALTENGLGGYSLSMVNQAFGKERLNHTIYTDYSQHSQGELNDIVSAGIRSIYAPFQTQVTLQKPPAGKEYVTFELRPDADGNYCGGLGGGQYGSSSPSGSGWVGRGTECGTWNSFSDIWFDGIMHELGHTLGIPHNYHPRTGATIFPVGSYLVDYNTPGYTTPFLQQERRYADWVLQSGAQESEMEPNDSALVAQDMDEPLARMKQIGDALDDQVVVSGRISDKSDADWYSITLTAGQRVALDVDSAEHQLGLDSTITIVDAQGNEVVTADNSLDRESQIASLDPFIIFQATKAGKYYAVVKGVGLSTGAYRLKVTPDSAMDKTAPRIYYVWPQPDQVVDETRQIVMWVDDLLDPATVNNQTFVLRGASTGIIQGQFAFDALDSTVIFTADSKLTPDTYTLTIAGGANGVKDLWGNALDGETTAGKLTYPAVSGNGATGGNFVTQIVVGAADTTPATVSSLSIHPPETGIRDAANRLFFQMVFSDEMDIASIYSADWQLRGSGADGKFDTADDQMQSLDVFVDKHNIQQNGVSLYALGNVPPGSYRFEASVLDAAGHNVQVEYTTFLGGVVPATAFFQDAAHTLPGLTGSYFNESLASAIAETDWRAAHTVSGTRVDPVLDFDTFGWGDRSQTGVTGGTSHWDNFSAQWDGFIEIPVDGVQLVTSSDDSSRLWIDLNRNGEFEPSELANNHFGQGQALTVGDPTQKIPAGSYAIRVQYEERGGGNDMILQWSNPSPELGWQRTHFAPVVIGTNIPVFSNMVAPFKEVVVKFGSDVDPATLTPQSFAVRYSPNERFFDSDDELLLAKDGTVQWNPITREATWKPAGVPKDGYYMVELSGEKNGIAAPNGALLDGEFLDSHIPGGSVLQGDDFSPSGDSIPGGTYRFTFTIDANAPSLGFTLNPSSILENGGITTGKVTRKSPDTTALVVKLSSSDPTAATVPTTVTIPAGASFVTFAIHAVDNSAPDGSKILDITASASGLASASVSLTIVDDETASLALTINPSLLAENGGTATGIVARNTPTTTAMVVNLSSSDPTAATVPVTVTIPAGAAYATFSIAAVNDSIASGNRTLDISASATGWASASTSLTIVDDDTASLALTFSPSSISENGGTTSGKIIRNTSTAAALVVTLHGSDSSAATIPATVTIPVGSTFVTFSVVAVNDSLANGNRELDISASAAGLISASASLTIVDDDVASLALTLSPPSISENGGTTTGRVTRNTPTASALVVSLSSSDPSAATAPTTVTIPAGADSATFSIAAVDDFVSDGNQTVSISASASGLASASASLTIVDDEVASLALTLSSSSISENGGTATGTVTRSSPTVSAVVVSLSSSDPSSATVPASVIIPAGASFATFNIAAVDNSVADGNRTLDISASATSLASASAPLTIVDDETSRLALTLSPSSISENGGISTGRVTRNTPTATALVVSLSSSDPAAATFPASVTIPAGASFATFTIAAVDDSVADGNQTLDIYSFATGMTSASASLAIVDDETASLALTFNPSSISENGGTSTGRVTRNTSTATALVVNLSSSAPTVVTVPATVTIPAGASFATFSVTAVDDSVATGNQILDIFVSGTGFASNSASLTIVDDDTSSLALTLSPSSISENGGAATGRVTRNTPTTTVLVVNLSSSDPSAATVPATVTIPAGSSFATFAITAVDDKLVDGTQLTTITSTASGHALAEATLAVTDDELGSVWKNQSNPLDVNNDGFTSTIDALLIINDINAFGARSLLDIPPKDYSPRQFIDVNGDYQSTPMDVLLVINYLNAEAIKNRKDLGEGEAADDRHAAVDHAMSDAAWLMDTSSDLTRKKERRIL